MAPDTKVYKKQDSFSGLTQAGTLEEVRPRLASLRARMKDLKFSTHSQDMLTAALGELLEGQAPEGQPPFQLYSYNIEEIKRLTDEELPRYLVYRFRYDTFPQRRQLDTFPPCIQIEPTSVCNYRCVFCYQVDKEFTSKKNGMMGMMPLGLYKQLIDQAEGRCEAITLASRGEPLICPDIKEMLAYSAGKFLALKLNTNAWFLDEAMAHAILQAGVNTLVFSADAASEPTYSQLRVNGNLERVFRNIEGFQKIRTQHYSESKMITRVSGVKFPQAGKLEDMEDFWGRQVDQVAFVNYNPWEDTYHQPENGITAFCSDLWRRTFVWWDGKVNPCDSDFKSTLAVGNANETSLEDLWRSETYMNLRERHASGNRSQCYPCNRCAVV